MDGFGGWLAQFSQVKAPIGDLARDAAMDSEWPEGPDELATYVDHLEDAGACQDALDTLEEAWARYQAGT